MTNAKDSKVSYRSLLVVRFSLLFAVVSGILSHDLVIGGTVLFSGIMSAYFASIGKRSNYIFGLIGYLLVGYLAFCNHLYGTAGFYLLACAPLQIQGFVSWSKNLENTNVKARKFTVKTSIIVIISCIIGSLIVGFLLSLIPSQELSFLDAASNCVNLCGIVLMNLRYMEAWWLWLVNNILDLAIWTYMLIASNGGTVMVFITCIMYLAINVYGIWKWMKESKVEKSIK